MKKALITGVTGQDGSFLSELLLENGYIVYGLVRRSSSEKFERIEHLFSNEKFHLLYGDLTDSLSLSNVISQTKPDEVYNLAAQSHVKVSFDVPEYTADTDGTGVLRILEAIRLQGLAKKCRFYQASTSELFGKVQEIPQSETTPFYPYSPYAVAKLYAYWIVREYRKAYGMFACNGILFNHESERRGESFVTRKITKAVARIVSGDKKPLVLGNIDSLRDWGYAKDYVRCMWLMLQQEEPDDFVIATGEQHSVREFCEKAFGVVGITIDWRGTGISEKGYNKTNGNILIEVSPEFYRPTDVVSLKGNPHKAQTILGWNPCSTSFSQLVTLMVEHDCKGVK